MEVTGEADFPPWRHPYLVVWESDAKFAVLTPNYRKLPESGGDGIYEGIDSVCCALISGEYQNAVQSRYSGTPIRLCKDKLLLSGHSAGGMLAMHAFLNHHALKPKHILLESPLLGPHVRSPHDVEYLGPHDVEYLGKPITIESLYQEATQFLVDLIFEGDPPIRLGSDPPNYMDLAVIMSTTRLRVVKNGVLQVCSLWEAFFRAEDIWTRLDRLQPLSETPTPTPMLSDEYIIDMREVLVMVGKKIRSGLQDDDEAFRLGKESLRKLGFSFNEEHGAIGYSVPTPAVKGLPLNCPSFTIIHGWSDVHVPIQSSAKLAAYIRNAYPKTAVCFLSPSKGHVFLDKADMNFLAFIQKRLLNSFIK
ncbi:hypothetical protein M011DRAFT_171602 [Sporormia fimetaria CBS 119925]|uniref:Alpha/beta-hydrolase n=1 Tax=Sporormia fimetaria CBS 119925 TaxID=1340428 RepID=A0A6A6V3D7_9PLEO|nr:hypothetical protein M011DRAFT_171602 [Sporormia fimetaria CBS 119925]